MESGNSKKSDTFLNEKNLIVSFQFSDVVFQKSYDVEFCGKIQSVCLYTSKTTAGMLEQPLGSLPPMTPPSDRRHST